MCILFTDPGKPWLNDFILILDKTRGKKNKMSLSEKWPCLFFCRTAVSFSCIAVPVRAFLAHLPFSRVDQLDSEAAVNLFVCD